MLNDPRKSLSFTYNSLNLPDEAKSGSTVKAKYLYSYDGVKVKVQDAGGTNGYDYLGSLTLVKASGTQTPECHFGDGIIRGTQVMYFEKDHLGSVRAVLNTSGTVLEKNDYYPFGMRHANASHVVTANNRYKFNGKEDQTVGALGLLDYGARMYDAQIGRWLTVDPLADSYYPISPYVYCYNNPIIHIDPDGESPVKIAKAVFNVGKRAYKTHKASGQIKVGKVLKEEGLSIWDNVTTIFDGDVSTFDKIIAGVDLVTGFGGEVKQGANALGIVDKTKKTKNPHGAKGKLDHQEKIKELEIKGLDENPGMDIVTEKKIRKDGSNRHPDVQVVDPETGETIKVYEAERNPKSKRNKLREEEYKRLDIEFETHKVGDW